MRLSPALRMLEQGGLTILSTPFRTGLFVGSGTALASAGPIGCLLAYIVMVRGQPRLRLLLAEPLTDSRSHTRRARSSTSS